MRCTRYIRVLPARNTMCNYVYCAVNVQRINVLKHIYNIFALPQLHRVSYLIQHCTYQTPISVGFNFLRIKKYIFERIFGPLGPFRY